MTFTERIRYVAGEHPFAWAAAHSIPKANMTVWLAGARPQRKTLAMLEEKTGIPASWWESGELPPPGKASVPAAVIERQVVYPRHGEEPTVAPVLAAPALRFARINADALAAIIEGALKTAPTASPQVIAAHCAKVYAQAIEDGLITPDGLGPAGALHDAA